MDDIRQRQIKLGIKLVAILIIFIVLSVCVCTNWFQDKKIRSTKEDEELKPVFTEEEIEFYIQEQLAIDPDFDAEATREELMSYMKTNTENEDEIINNYEPENIDENNENNEESNGELIETPEETYNGGYDTSKIEAFLNSKRKESESASEAKQEETKEEEEVKVEVKEEIKEESGEEAKQEIIIESVGSESPYIKVLPEGV